MTVSLDHEALAVYQGFTKGQKSAKVCSALILYNVHTKKNRNDAAKLKLKDRKIYSMEKALKVADYRIRCILSGDPDPGNGAPVYLDVLAGEEKIRSLRGGRF